MVQNPSPPFLRSDQAVGFGQLRDAEINTSVGDYGHWAEDNSRVPNEINKGNRLFILHGFSVV